MAKLKYPVDKKFKMSYEGNVMLRELTKIYGCESESKFIRNCIAEQVFKLDETLSEKYIQAGTREVIDFYWNYLAKNEVRK